MSATQERAVVAERRETARRMAKSCFTVREISIRLGVSMRTVERYLNRMRADHGPRSTTPYGRKG